MNTRKGKEKFKSFQIRLDSGCSSTIVMWRLVQRLGPKKGVVMQWHIQAGNITTNIKVEIYFTLTELSTTNVMTWDFYVGESAKGGYAMILVRDRLNELGLYLNYLITLSKQMVDLLKSLGHPWLIWVCTNLKI